MNLHELLHVTCPQGSGCAAQCACGWLSEFYPSAGLAGAAWDTHLHQAGGG